MDQKTNDGVWWLAGAEHIEEKLRSPALQLWPYAAEQDKDQQQHSIWEDKIR